MYHSSIVQYFYWAFSVYIGIEFAEGRAFRIPQHFLLFDKLEVVALIRQNTLLGTGLTAVFNIVTYILYVNQLMTAADSFVIVILALVYFVPGMVEMIEDVQSGCESNPIFFWIRICGVILALGYIGVLWYFLSQYDQTFLNGLPKIPQWLMIGLPAVFLIQKVLPVMIVISQLYNKSVQQESN